jgi:carboxypeptidase Q
MRKFVQHSLLLALASPIMAFAQSTEPVDQAVINRIRKEGLENSKVMDIAFNLTDMSGPRLANSPGYSRAANYAINTLKSFGVEKADLDAWGEFGKGWELEKSYMAMTAPYYRPIMIYPKTWTAGNKKLQNAEVLVISAKDSADLMKYAVAS